MIIITPIIDEVYTIASESYHRNDRRYQSLISRFHMAILPSNVRSSESNLGIHRESGRVLVW